MTGSGDVAVLGTTGGVSIAAPREGAGEAGLEPFVAEPDKALLMEGLGSFDRGTGGLDSDLTSSRPPPEVTRDFSAVFFRQKDHFGLASSACGAVSSVSASGSPKRDRLVQLSRFSWTLSVWRDLRDTGMLSKEVFGVGFGRERAY